MTAYLWELAEYQTFVLKIEEVGIYRDTIKDIASGLSGSLVAAIVLLVAWHRAGRRRQVAGVAGSQAMRGASL